VYYYDEIVCPVRRQRQIVITLLITIALPIACHYISHFTKQMAIRLGMALKASNVVGNPVTLHRIW
jgi:hypothetical protein